MNSNARAKANTNSSQEEIAILKDKLQVLDKQMQELVYAVGHDLKAPLRQALGFSDLLLQHSQGKFDEQTSLYVSRLVHSVKKMEILLEAFLNFGRASINNLQIEKVDCSLLLEDVLNNCNEIIVASNGTISYDKLPIIMADPKRLTLLFEHLIGNAIKFCNNKPTVHISARQVDKNWQFAVKDNGIGIDTNDFERIFKLFQRLHATDSYPGAGVGLTICQRIIELHEGKIWIESELGKGSIVFFTLPANIAEDNK
jgi:light-regulated signal transduction histidine kinase (bacteriophytochrome)